MKKIFFILISFLICSCYWSNNLNDDRHDYSSRSSKYFWYYDHELFNDVEYCQLIGILTDESNDPIDVQYINKQCKIYNDTIYIKKRTIKPEYNVFEGIIYINDIEYNVNIKLK